MGIEDTYDGVESGAGSGESSREKTESPSSKAKAQKVKQYIQKAQKDEKKAKNDDDELFLVLTRFLQDPTSAPLILILIRILGLGVPARFILGMISFFSSDALDFMNRSLPHLSLSQVVQKIPDQKETHEFRESELSPEIRQWMSVWVAGLYDFLLSTHASQMSQHKLLRQLRDQSIYPLCLEFQTNVFILFFFKKGYKLPRVLAQKYVEFIFSGLSTRLAGLVTTQTLEDPDYFAQRDLDGAETLQALFGSGSKE